jgi:hypothetical protein
MPTERQRPLAGDRRQADEADLRIVETADATAGDFIGALAALLAIEDAVASPPANEKAASGDRPSGPATVK